MLELLDKTISSPCHRLDFNCAAQAFNQYLSGEFAWIVVKTDFTIWWLSPSAESLLHVTAADAGETSLIHLLAIEPEKLSSIGPTAPLVVHNRSGQTLVLVATPLQDVHGGPFVGHLIQVSKAPPETLRSSVLMQTSRSKTMRHILDMAKRVAQHDVNVLITGETGTGKSELAKLMHAFSPRANGPFRVLNCAGFSDELFNTELFGYEKGSYTGAFETKVGLLELGNHGTVFLDDVNSLPPLSQAKLLEFLDTKTIRRIGGRQAIPLDVRILSATNESLKQKVAEGKFREDLFFRLNGFSFHLPPLRERAEEIEHIVSHISSTRFFYPKTFAADAIEMLKTQPWDGNVRELIHTVDMAYIESGNSPVIELQHVQATLAEQAQDEIMPTKQHAAPPSSCRVEPTVSKEQIMASLEETRYRRGKAAERLGISRSTLWRLMREWNIA
jgi:transcriptional regulator with PAS, ATPase and Fis domain